MQRSRTILAMILPLVLAGCAATDTPQAETFGENLRKLSSNVHTIVLTDNFGKSRVAVVPKFQGRVMTSTPGGTDGFSIGKINHEVIVGATTMPKFSSVGGEERLTFGPEGGSFGLFFPSGAEFTKENYAIPDALEKESFEILERAADKITLTKRLTLTNYANKIFQMKVTRTVKVLPVSTAWHELGAPQNSAVAIVAYESENTLANFSKTPWRKEEGLPSLSTVHSVAAGADAVAILPVLKTPTTRAPEFTGDYGDPIPLERVTVSAEAVILKAGGTPAKLGIKPQNTAGVMAVYDPASQTLTVVQFMPFTPGGLYADGRWQFAKNPYAGDAATASAGNGKIDLQTFSPALELAGWASASHTARTFHLRGKAADLDPIAKNILGVSILPYAPK